MKNLVAYITSGYPDKNFTIDLALALNESGVDTLELGVPFSDPVADGPLIEAANHKALELGFRFSDLIEISHNIGTEVDLLWMGYFNSFYQQNFPELLAKMSSYGVGGLIIPDLPHEEAVAYKELFEMHRLANISFVAPTDTKERIQTVVSDAQKFIYMVAYAGITGSGVSEDLEPFLASIKEYTHTPVYVGFGVNEKTAKEKVKGADGVIVGSAFIKILLQDELSLSQKIINCAHLAKTIKAKINE